MKSPVHEDILRIIKELKDKIKNTKNENDKEAYQEQLDYYETLKEQMEINHD